MPEEKFDLAGIFNSVTQSLASNQQSLNHADIYNQDHGDNMVQTFQVITDALMKKRGLSTSKALSYAAKTLSKSTTSASGQIYAQNLARAAAGFKGQSLNTTNALSLLQTLIGGQAGQSASLPAGGDMLGTLLGSLTGGGQAPIQQSQPSGGEDLLGELMSSLGGGAGSSAQVPSQSSGGDLLGSLLGGLLGGSGGGGGGLESLVQAFLGGSGMGDASHRQESTQLVINAFLRALGSLNK